jgi:DNA ligase-1
VKPALVRALIEERVDPILFRMSWDYVGDMAETVALLWPKRSDEPAELDDGSLRIGAVIERLSALGRSEAPAAIAEMLDHLDASGRYALLKFATGELRMGISARLAKTALAQAFGLDVDAVEEVWHGIAPPYLPLFEWAEGRGEQPRAQDVPVFRSFMLAHPLEGRALEEQTISLADYAAEWKWDGIRVQLVRVGDQTRLYSRAGDDITRSFPDVAEAFDLEGVLDGELLVKGEAQGSGDAGLAASFNALQQRLGRKAVSARMLSEYPAFVRLYDVMVDGREDLRALPWTERRARLEALVPRLDPARFDLSGLIEAPDFEALAEIRAGARDASIEGMMLKRRDSPMWRGGERVCGTSGSAIRSPPTAWSCMRSGGRGSDHPSTPTIRSAAGRGLSRAKASCCRSARPIWASPTRSWRGWTGSCATTRCSGSGRCGRWRRAWCSKWRSIRSTSASGTSRASRCGFRGLRASGRTSRRMRRIRSRR